MPNAIAVGQTVRAYPYGDLPKKKLDFSYPAFRGQSKSSEQTRIGYTYDSLLTFVASTGRLLYRFQDIARYWLNIADFFLWNQVYLMPPLRRFPVELCNSIWAKKIRKIGLYLAKKRVWWYLQPFGCHGEERETRAGPKKLHPFYFANNSVKPRSMLIIFGTQIPERIFHRLHTSYSLYTQAQRTSLIFFLFTW